MVDIYSLYSSSKGNATFVGDKTGGILVDVGISLRDLKRCLSLNDIDTTAISAIFITHEHSDHIKGLSVISKKLDVPIYASRETLEQIIAKDLVSVGADLNEINKRTVDIADFEVGAFTTPHDSAHSLGFCIRTREQRQICICTDLGHLSNEVYANLQGSDMVLLESNYDETMLMYGDYPYALKRRIKSKNGHLSNDDCSKTLVQLLEDGTTKFILGHLSENNNRPEIALETALRILSNAGAIQDKDYILDIAKPRL